MSAHKTLTVAGVTLERTVGGWKCPGVQFINFSGWWRTVTVDGTGSGYRKLEHCVMDWRNRTEAKR